MELSATCTDGPLMGASFDVQRAPELMRFTIDGQGRQWVLDLPNDQVGPDEQVYAYRRTSVGYACRGPGAGRFALYDYVGQVNVETQEIIEPTAEQAKVYSDAARALMLEWMKGGTKPKRARPAATKPSPPPTQEALF